MYNLVMELKSYGQTHTGLRRKANQDAFLMDEDIQLFAIADGMGGHTGGEIASSLAIKILSDHMKQAVKSPDFLPRPALLEAIKKANHSIFEQSKKNKNTLTGMGTTLAACFFWDDTCYAVNVGDSRVYLFESSSLWRLTEDHSLLNHQLKKGLITENQKHLMVDSNVITRSVGFLPQVEVDLFKRKLSKNDIFIICSDGLHGMIDDEKISEICKKYTPKELSEQCIQSALDAGGSDNVSVVVVTL